LRWRGDRPSRFEAAWVTHEKFGLFMQENWRKDSDLVLALEDMTCRLKAWNKDVFGNIFNLKKKKG
jgi:hypothetical protein